MVQVSRHHTHQKDQPERIPLADVEIWGHLGLTVESLRRRLGGPLAMGNRPPLSQVPDSEFFDLKKKTRKMWRKMAMGCVPILPGRKLQQEWTPFTFHQLSSALSVRKTALFIDLNPVHSPELCCFLRNSLLERVLMMNLRSEEKRKSSPDLELVDIVRYSGAQWPRDCSTSSGDTPSPVQQ